MKKKQKKSNQAVVGYWDLVEPAFDAVDIYKSPEVFLAQFRPLAPETGHLLAAHWCQSEVCNGGFQQFFANSTGVLAPEALQAFDAIGLTEWAGLLREAMAFFGADYPRLRKLREQRLSADQKLADQAGQGRDWDPFRALDDRFFAWLGPNGDAWEQAADAYALRAAARAVAADPSNLAAQTMQATLATRKPVEELTVADLEAFPVWEFATEEEGAEEQDETWVKPVPAATVPADGYSLSVAAALKLASGLVYPGVLFCDTHAGFEVAALALLTTGGRVLFTPGDTPAEIRRALKRLGLSHAQVFPLEYCSRAPSARSGKPERGSFAVPRA